MISIIVATGKNREIGGNNGLLWKIPEELKRFKEITTGHPIIMGRKTHESIGRPLPNRTNIVITRDNSYKAEGVEVAYSLDEAIKLAYTVIPAEAGIQGNLSTGSRIKSGMTEEIFVIGGGQIFAESLPIADKLYLTIVDQEFPEADVFFPEYPEFKITSESATQESSGYKYKFLELEK